MKFCPPTLVNFVIISCCWNSWFWLGVKNPPTSFKISILVWIFSGPDDDVITPWQSAHFGFYDKNLTVVPMKSRTIYQEDAIGLRSLDETGKLKIVTVPHVKHVAWHLNKTLIDEVVVPHLDWTSHQKRNIFNRLANTISRTAYLFYIYKCLWQINWNYR